MRIELIATFAALAVLVAMPARAEPKAEPKAEPRAQQRVTITGCPYAGVTASCLMIKSSDGKVYNITGVTPKPRQLDRRIRLRGTVTDKLSMCNQGVVLDRIRWTRTRQQCTN